MFFGSTVMAIFFGNIQAYFSDTVEIKNNRIMLVSSLPHSPDGELGLIYQRKIADKLIAEGGIGGSAAGRHLSIGLNYVLNQSERFRPLARVGLSYLNGTGPKTETFTGGFCPFGCPIDSITYETHPGLFGTINGGFQFRISKKWGLEGTVGWVQTILGGGHQVIFRTSGSDVDDWESLVKAASTGGVTGNSRMFWEF